MKATAWLTVTVAALTGCATINATECQNAYDVGFRDAIFGLQRQDPIYAPLCSRQGTQLDLAAYSQGWQEGYYEYERRKVHGGVD
jgi:hypothetical protein